MDLREANPETASINILNASHQRFLEVALARILDTELAEETYAEILDGLPTRATWLEFNNWFWAEHPAMNHIELCPGVRERVREYRAAFDINKLGFARSTLLAYQEAPSGTKQFHLRLLELLAVSCHQIAVHLYQVNSSTHHDGQHDRWRNDSSIYRPLRGVKPPRIVFSHGAYDEVDQYPNGIADVVGYWAEARIFGGVIVFDRGESGTECRELYIHAYRIQAPRTIWPLTSTQFDQLISFLLTQDNDQSASLPETSASPSCPLPILASSANRWRWHAWDAFVKFHIFRDRYERKVSEARPIECNMRVRDWPEVLDMYFVSNALFERQEGKYVDQAEIDAAEKRMKMITPSSPLAYSRGDQYREGDEFCE